MHTPSRNQGIDLLRGLSILLVVMHHLAIRIPLSSGYLPRWLVRGLLFNGYESVFVFFVISGFLITHNALARWGALVQIPLGPFYLRRASRILPLLLILIGILSLFHLLRIKYYVIARTGQSLGRAVLAALGLHLNWYEGHTGYLPGGWDVLWSLSIEEAFYLGFPIVCLLLRRDWLLASIATLLALSLPASHAALAGNEIWQEKAYLPGMAAIATGILGAMIARRFSVKDRSIVNGLLVAGTLGLLAVYFGQKTVWSHLKDSTLLLLTISSGCLVLAFHWRRPRISGTQWIQSCGRLSYEIYLTHMFVVFLLVRLFAAGGSDLKWGALWYPPTLGLSWALGWVVAREISIPAERALRNSYPAFFKSRSAASATAANPPNAARQA